ncbi:MAG: 30S ribosomal protein S9 [Pedobacter sp.]|nr:MAG: 30S ribosomal protein S9 [Pedobacter sp.]
MSTNTVGKRKTAIAKVRLETGSGKILINGKLAKDYFQSFEEAQSIRTPLVLTNWTSEVDFQVKVSGGGLSAQLDSVRSAIAKALCLQEPKTRPVLKKALLLRRDARIKERRKYGLKKARKASQYSKR